MPGTVRPLCTVGTPSRTELDAVARLAATGWRIAVRADFDCAGLALVRAVIDAVPDAEVWRMTADRAVAVAEDLQLPFLLAGAAGGRQQHNGCPPCPLVLPERTTQPLAVPLRDHDVVGVTAQQVLGMLGLGVQRVAGHDDPRCCWPPHVSTPP
ncbi:DUF2399 domain-containing protein [Streptomyces sp. B21-101]|uniref:DUF2399 domain-containing protein n=1 Tax=Streptomyces sp. B21-101 TaxID=3039415 RepID=UPI003FA762A9